MNEPRPVCFESTAHRGNAVIKIVFDYDTDLAQRVKLLPGAAWSQTMRCWYVPDTDGYRSRLQPEHRYYLRDIATVPEVHKKYFGVRRKKRVLQKISVFTACATVLPRTCWRRELISAILRICWVILISELRSVTCLYGKTSWWRLWARWMTCGKMKVNGKLCIARPRQWKNGNGSVLIIREVRNIWKCEGVW